MLGMNGGGLFWMMRRMGREVGMRMGRDQGNGKVALLRSVADGWLCRRGRGRGKKGVSN